MKNIALAFYLLWIGLAYPGVRSPPSVGRETEKGGIRVVPSSNQISLRSGKYRCSDCGYEVVVNKGGRFPRCPLHPHPADWQLVRELAPQAPAAKQ